MNFLDYTSALEINPYLLLVIVAWTLAWKGVALWKSAKLNKPIWFVVLLIVNTLGILEILYIFLFSKISANGKNPAPKKAKRKR